MAKRLNFEDTSKQQKMILNGISPVWEGSTPKEHFVSLKRHSQIKSEEKRKIKAKTPKALADCPFCGQPVGRLKHHIQKAHRVLADENQP